MRFLSGIFLFIVIFLIPLVPARASVFKDPTGGKPLSQWLWQDQFRPTLKVAGDSGSAMILAGGLSATAIASQYDQDVQYHVQHHQILHDDHTAWGSLMGSGAPGIAIAVAQLAFDQENGLMHARALALTSMTHISIALATRRERPNGRDHFSYPSGHVSSSFATATSLAYAYGPWVGVPAFLAAGFIGLSRVQDNVHWMSDTVAGAALGIFWARASANSIVNKQSKFTLRPVLVPSGGVLVMSGEF